MSLNFDTLREKNVRRCEDVFHKVKWWSPSDWAMAVTGELGKACNLLKKRMRGEVIPVIDIADELADTVIYLDLLAARLDINLGEAVIRKFNIVSDQRGSKIKLEVGK